MVHHVVHLVGALVERACEELTNRLCRVIVGVILLHTLVGLLSRDSGLVLDGTPINVLLYSKNWVFVYHFHEAIHRQQLDNSQDPAC